MISVVNCIGRRLGGNHQIEILQVKPREVLVALLNALETGFIYRHAHKLCIATFFPQRFNQPRVEAFCTTDRSRI